MLQNEKINAYVKVLHDELVPATGCTEPIAIAYGAALLRKTLGEIPESVVAEVSGNIIKNVKSVVVPNTGGLKGIRAAISAGIVAGEADEILQVISRVNVSDHGEIARYATETPIDIICVETSHLLDIKLIGRKGEHSAIVHIADSHSNVVRLEKDGEVLLEKPLSDNAVVVDQDRPAMTVEEILEFANTVDLELVREFIERQINYNSAIAEEGIRGKWGANIGSTLLSSYPEDIKNEAKAWAAAGSDARMSGCEMPVVICSGSGNQGMTASLPVVRYAKHLGVDHDKMLRAVILSDLVTIHQKSGIGRLSAYCGAISAGVGAGAGIAYLLEGTYDAIAHTIVNAVAILSGTICDGAKPSCAAKIAAAVDAGILGYEMWRNGDEFKGGDGIVTKGVDATIANVGVLAKEGMQITDKVILEIMTHRCD
ncbi:MAG: serine dehydratase subunit alpha family protein [Oscillospiraceae bacterium]|nr:serine dehydratase subunit alpha family protein [Oscillospiraceae bacterium]